MKRTALLRRARVSSVSAQRRRGRARLKPLSAKRKALLPARTALLLGLKDLVGWRCEFCGSHERPLEGHENRKPRATYWLDPEHVVILCGGPRGCHQFAERAYAKGRLEIPGTRSQGWGFALVYAANKVSRRDG